MSGRHAFLFSIDIIRFFVIHFFCTVGMSSGLGHEDFNENGARNVFSLNDFNSNALKIIQVEKRTRLIFNLLTRPTSFRKDYRTNRFLISAETRVWHISYNGNCSKYNLLVSFASTLKTGRGVIPKLLPVTYVRKWTTCYEF